MYFTIWLDIEFMEYEWNFSKNNLIKALQYLIYGVWGLYTFTSPFIIVFWSIIKFTKEDYN